MTPAPLDTNFVEFRLPPRPFPEESAKVEQMLSELRDGMWAKHLKNFHPGKLTSREREAIANSSEPASEVARHYDITESYVYMLRKKAGRASVAPARIRQLQREAEEVNSSNGRLKEPHLSKRR